MSEASNYIKKFGMRPHHKHRFYVRSGRSEKTFIPEHFKTERPYWDSIYYLLEPGQILRFHHLNCDELWFYHDGDSMTLHYITEDRQLVSRKLGANIDAGESPFLAIPAGVIFGAEASWDKYSLVSCVTVPGMLQEDFNVCDREDLTAKFPQLADIITRLTY